MIQINKGKHTGIVKWQKCQCTRSMKGASLVFGCIAFLRRLPDCAVLEVYWGIQDAHHNKMLMADTKHCADRISIRGLLTVREREGWMPECSNPTCFSLHLLERGWNQPPGRSISASAWPHLSPLHERQVSPWQDEAARLRRVRDYAWLFGQTSQHFAETFIRLPAWKHTDRGQHLIRAQSPVLELDPQLLLNQGECDKPSHIVHQPPAAGLCWDIVRLCRSLPLTRFLPGGSGSSADVVF